VRSSLSNDGEEVAAHERFRSESVNYDNVWILDRIEREQGQ
jgi:hypothetical protein